MNQCVGRQADQAVDDICALRLHCAAVVRGAREAAAWARHGEGGEHTEAAGAGEERNGVLKDGWRA
jgi:hypothetical protein